MGEFPEDFLTTNKLLYLRGIDGESQIPLMKNLAKIAQELYDKYPEFCALVPFGSRTKGLSLTGKSDIDLIIILDYSDISKMNALENAIEDLLGAELSLPLGIRFVDIEEYRKPRTKYLVVNHLMYGTKLGPSRLNRCYLGEDTRDAILASLNNSEEVGIQHKFIPQENKFLKNRRRLWRNRISSLLGGKEAH